MVRLALQRPVSTLVGVLALSCLGALSLARLPVSLLPSIERPRIVVRARSASRSSDELREAVTIPLERQLQAVRGLDTMRSVTSDGEARIVLQAAWQADADRVRADVARLCDGVARVPLDELSIAAADGDASPSIEVAVRGGDSAAARSAFAARVLVPELARLPGAGRIELLGQAPRRVVVRPHAAALAARGMTARDLGDRLATVGRPVSAGQVRDGAALLPLSIVERAASVEQVRALPVAAHQGLVPLGDVAAVALEEVPDGTAFTWNGRDGVLVRLYRAPGANAVALSRAVRTLLADLGPRAAGAGGLVLDVASDGSADVASALVELLLGAAAGILLGTVVLRMATGSYRATLALCVVIPASLLASFAAFDLASVALDLVSLAGLALAAGMLVDNSIVVLEAIEAARERGVADAALAGTRHVSTAVIASSCATVVVFLPLAAMHGLARAFFGEQAFAVAASLCASLLLSLTLTPVLARRSAPAAPGRALGRGAYLALLERTLARPRLALLAGAAVTAASLGALRALPCKLVPDTGSRTLVARYRLPPAASPDGERAVGRAVDEAVTRAVAGQGAADVLHRRGLEEDGAGDAIDGGRSGEVEIRFATRAAAAAALPRLARALASVPDAEARVAPRRGAVEALVGAQGGALELVVSAPEAARTEALAQRVASDLRARAGVELELARDERAQPALVLSWDDARLASLGLQRDALEGQVTAALGAREAGIVQVPEAEPEMRIEPVDPGSPRLVPVAAGAGASAAIVPLGALARADVRARSPRQWREQGRPAARLVQAGGGAIDALQLEALVRGLALQPGEEVRLAGEALDVSRAFRELVGHFALSLLLVFLVIAAFYESFLLPPLVMAAVPVGAGGGLALLALSGQTLDMMSFVGLIMLGGLVANHTIVLVDRMEQARRGGADAAAAVRAAAAERYRPILMTTLTTMLGMLPLALLAGEGLELRRGLAIAVLGGLATSTFASLLLVPVLYQAVDGWRARPAPAGR